MVLVWRKKFKYCRYKEAEPLASKDSAEVAKAFQSIYKCSPLTWPDMLQQVDPDCVLKELQPKDSLSMDLVFYKICFKRYKRR